MNAETIAKQVEDILRRQATNAERIHVVSDNDNEFVAFVRPGSPVVECDLGAVARELGDDVTIKLETTDDGSLEVALLGGQIDGSRCNVWIKRPEK